MKSSRGTTGLDERSPRDDRKRAAALVGGGDTRHQDRRCADGMQTGAGQELTGALFSVARRVFAHFFCGVKSSEVLQIINNRCTVTSSDNSPLYKIF